MAVLPTVGVVVFIGSVGPYFSLGDVQIQALGELILSRIAAIAAEGYHIFRLVGNDIDYTADGIRTIKGRSCSVQHLDALDAGHVYLVEVDVTGDVSRDLASVYQYQHVLVGESVHHQIGPHRVRTEGERGYHHGQGLLEVGDTGTLYLVGSDNRYRRRSVLQSLMCTRTRYYDRVQLVSFLGHIVAVTFFCLCIGTGGDDSSHKENCEKSFLYHILFYFI